MEVDSPATPVDDVSAEPAALTEEEGQSLDLLDVEEHSILENKSKGKNHSYDSMTVDSPVEHSEQLDMSLEMLEKFFKGASRAFFNEYGLVSHQINSYNEFVKNGLQELFDSLGPVAVEPDYNPQDAKVDGSWKHATVTFGKVRLEKPVFWVEKNDLDEQELKLTPKHARLQNMTYSAQMKVKVRVQVYVHRVSDKAKTGQDAGVHKMLVDDKESEIVLGRLPVMVRSDLCWLPSQDKNDCFFDPGGYFLIKGMEKTFIAQEQRCLSRLWITDKPCWTVQYMSEIKRRRVYIKLLESTKAEGSSGVKMISLYFLYATMPIWIMFFALGVSSDKEVFEMIDLDGTSTDVVNMILATIRDADGICEGFRRGGKAREFVNKLIKDAKFPPTESFDEYINKFLFPRITGLRQKALFLGYMIKCLLLSYMGKRKCDNKDDFRNKRLELAGKLLSRELWAHIRHAERRMVKAMQRDLNGDELQFTERYLDSSIITNGLNRAFSTGQWCHPYKRTERTAGIVATLRRTNPLQLISDLRKTRQSVLYAGKAGDARYPNPSYFGRLCFLSTPDGENCGLVKNLAITALVSSKLSETIIEVLISCGMDKLEGALLSSLSKRVKVLLNGEWIGVCRDAESFVYKFKQLRRAGKIHPQVEVKRDDHQKEVRIFTDAGRILRPLVIVENLKNVNKYEGRFASFQSLMDAKIIELIGVEEEEDCRTAWGVKYLYKKDDKQSIVNYTHCELDLSFLLALSCGIIPFANHNFARRVLYQAEKHSQQAIGFSTTNPDIRADTLTHQMYYPQKPLFRTMTAECLGMSDYRFGKGHIVRPELFNGQNAIVAVNVHLGYNQEDSLVMNEASVQRGLFRTEHFRSYKADVDNKENSLRLKPKDKVDFGKMQSKRGRVDSLEDDGLPYVGAYLNSGDIVIGKVAESGEDHGVKLKHTEKGVVQKVLLSSNDEGKNFAVVTLRQDFGPENGSVKDDLHLLALYESMTLKRTQMMEENDHAVDPT